MGSSGAALALLPILISGYLFNLIFYPIRYFNNKADGQRLFFMAAGSGLLIAAATFWMASLASAHSYYLGSWLQQFVGNFAAAIPLPHATKLTATVFFAVLLAFLFNLTLSGIFTKFKGPTAKLVYNKITDVLGTPMAQLFRRAVNTQKFVLVTMKCRKIYCRRILEVPPDLDRENACIEILPCFSGYRDKDTLRMGSERTQYPAIAQWEAEQYLHSRKIVLKDLSDQIARLDAGAGIEEMEAARQKVENEVKQAEAELLKLNLPEKFCINDWIKVIPICEIESAGFYDPVAYEHWFKLRPNEKQQESG